MMCSGSASIRWKKMVSRAGMTILLLSVLIAIAEARYNSELYRRSNRSPAGLGPPVRPKVFHSADELTTYLAELADYYAVLGRPRFGKRGSSASSSSSKAHLPSLIRGYRQFRKRADDEDDVEFMFNNDQEERRSEAADDMRGGASNQW